MRKVWPTTSLGVRLGTTLFLALVPLGIITFIQTQNTLRQVEEATLDGVGGAALKAVRAKTDRIVEAQVAARTLAMTIGADRLTGPACIDRMRAVAEELPDATLVAFFPVSGMMTCSSTGQAFDFKNNPLFMKLFENPVPQLVYNPRGPVSKTAVIGAIHPVFDQRDVLLGFIGISLSYGSIAPDAYFDSLALWRPFYIATFQPDGSVLLASDPDVAVTSVFPGGMNRERLAELTDRATFVATPEGRHILSVVRVTPDLYLASVWERQTRGFWTDASNVTPYLLPVLTLVAAFAVAAFASSRLVVRHVRALVRSMDDYITTNRRAEIPNLGDAPSEIQRLHAAYEGLIRTIEQEEAELQNLLVDKDNLLREVDHRSGNSLQIIASVMRMYRRETTDPKLQHVLDSLINRVIAISSTHTSLYSVSGKQDIAMDMVLSNVVRRLKEIHSIRAGVATKDFDPIRMDAQSAVPLALALAETVGCYFGRPDLADAAVTVALRERDGEIELQVTGPAVPELRPDTTDGLTALPQRMLRQFAVQLGGKVSITQDDDVVTVRMAFSRPQGSGAA